MDVYGRNVRSYVMSRIRGRNTSAELLLRRSLWASGLRGYRIHGRLPGSPDICWKSLHLAVFVDGCFWHKCPMCKIRTPLNNRNYWQSKLKRNQLRDRRVDRTLGELGWTIIRFWEHEVRQTPSKCVRQVKITHKALLKSRGKRPN
jgi:DNA mismatch endonuclease (patch repair protein)